MNGFLADGQSRHADGVERQFHQDLARLERLLETCQTEETRQQVVKELALLRRDFDRMLRKVNNHNVY